MRRVRSRDLQNFDGLFFFLVLVALGRLAADEPERQRLISDAGAVPPLVSWLLHNDARPEGEAPVDKMLRPVGAHALGEAVARKLNELDRSDRSADVFENAYRYDAAAAERFRAARLWRENAGAPARADRMYT